MKINKEQALIMRGMAIMSIMLHNLIHLEKFGFARENEMEYHLSRTQVFFDHVFNANSILSVLGDIISFIGWFGVPVFVFFSGYGLATKYGDQFVSNFDKKNYLKYSYMKLLLLILPSAIFFILFRVAIGDWQRIVEILFSFTFLNSLFSGIIIKLHYAAPPFWYFSLTFQLYIIWLLLKNMSNRRIMIFGGGLLLLQMIFNPEFFGQKAISYMHYNFIAWIPLFVIGILFSRINIDVNIDAKCKVNTIIVFTISFVASFIINKNFYLWTLMPFVSVLFFFALASIVYSIKPLKKLWVWIGGLSSYIFVVHPIAQMLSEKVSSVCQARAIPMRLLYVVIIYVCLTFTLVYLYKPIHIFLIKIYNNKK